jgi:hypothetical protein
MKRDESVFFFTLIDFLLTTLFFGFVVFLLARKSANAAETKEVEAARASATVDSLVRANGLSDLRELTDALTRLGPLGAAVEATSLVRQSGGLQEVKRSMATVAAAGGRDSVAGRLERLKAREGAGLPHCLAVDPAGKQAKVLATVVATDSTITFTEPTADLAVVLSRLGVTYESIQTLSVSKFRRTFLRLADEHPDCRYTLRFLERTRYVDARDAARGIFYLRISSSK